MSKRKGINRLISEFDVACQKYASAGGGGPEDDPVLEAAYLDAWQALRDAARELLDALEIAIANAKADEPIASDMEHVEEVFGRLQGWRRKS